MAKWFGVALCLALLVLVQSLPLEEKKEKELPVGRAREARDLRIIQSDHREARVHGEKPGHLMRGEFDFKSHLNRGARAAEEGREKPSPMRLWDIPGRREKRNAAGGFGKERPGRSLIGKSALGKMKNDIPRIDERNHK